MAKSSGLGMAVSVDDSSGTLRAITNDVTSLSIDTPRGAQDITGVDKSGIEKLLLLADGKISMSGVFNPAATTGQHTVLRTMSSSTVVRTVTIVINSTPTATLSMEMVCAAYTITRGGDGSLVWKADFVLADGTVPLWS